MKKMGISLLGPVGYSGFRFLLFDSGWVGFWLGMAGSNRVRLEPVGSSWVQFCMPCSGPFD
jgi:hypothetical protein